MKKAKIISSILLMVLCVGILGIGIYAAVPTSNKVTGVIRVNRASPLIGLTAYYNTVAPGNEIGTRKETRTGVDIDLTDSKLTFAMNGVDTVDEVADKKVIIVIENTVGYDLAAWFSLSPDAEPEASIAPQTYGAKTQEATPQTIPEVLKVSFSSYTRVPKNSSVQVTLTLSLLKLLDVPSQTNLLDTVIYLNVLAEIDENLFSNIQITENAGTPSESTTSAELGGLQAVSSTFSLTQSATEGFSSIYTQSKPATIKVVDEQSESLKFNISATNANGEDTQAIVGIFSQAAYQTAYTKGGNDDLGALLFATENGGAQHIDGVDGALGFYATNINLNNYKTSSTITTYSEIEIPLQYVFTGNVDELELYIVVGATNLQQVTVTLTSEFLAEYEEVRYVLTDDQQGYIYHKYKNYITTPVGDVAVPNKYNHKPVTQIDNYAFAYNTSLTGLNLSGCSNLASISKEMITGCTALANVNLSGLTKLSTIGTFFRNNTSIQSVNLSDCTRLGGSLNDYEFYGCSALITVNLSGCINIEQLGTMLFWGCNALESVNISGCSALTTIVCAFPGCAELSTVNLSGCTNLATIGESAFITCAKLTSIDLSGCTNLETIGKEAFSGCGLTSIDLSGCTNLAIIGEGAFRGCDFTSVNLSGLTRLTTIDAEAFYNCELLANINLRTCTGLKTIGGAAFAHCDALTEIYIPASVTTILIGDLNAGPFYGCSEDLVINCGAEGPGKDWATGWDSYGAASLDIHLTVNWGVQP